MPINKYRQNELEKSPLDKQHGDKCYKRHTVDAKIRRQRLEEESGYLQSRSPMKDVEFQEKNS